MSAAGVDNPHRRDTVWIRSKGQSRFMRALGWAEIGLAIFFVTAFLFSPASGRIDRQGLPLLMVLFFVPAIALAFRIARMGCRIEDDGLRVKNQFFEFVVPWRRMDHFSFDRNGAGRVARVHLQDGGAIKIAGIASPPFAPSKSASYNLVVGLQVELDRHRHSPTVD
jgi:hypothetical protein